MNQRASVRQRSMRASVVRGLGIVLVLLGAFVLVAQVVAPEQTQRTGGAIIGAARQAYNAAVQGDSPVAIELGPPGGDEAIDSAPYGVFTEMASYRVAARLQPVFAAHNGSGGDVILPLSIGDRVDIIDAEGAQREMVVTDARDTAQVGATTADLSGMSGAMLVQTCYWDTDEMRFLALTPLGETPTTATLDDDGAELIVP